MNKQSNKRTFHGIHQALRPLMDFARVMDYLENTDPEAVFEANNACISFSCSKTERPKDALIERAVNSDLFISGAGKKPSAYIGSLYYLWGENEDGPCLMGFRISSEPYILRDCQQKGIIPATQEMRENPNTWHKNRPVDLAWIAHRFEWLWQHSEMDGEAPPDTWQLWVTKPGEYYQDHPDGTVNLDLLQPLTTYLEQYIITREEQASETRKMTVYDLLKYPYTGVRISCGGDAWLTFDGVDWEVWQSGRGRFGRGICAYSGPDEHKAVAMLAKLNGMNLVDPDDEEG